jgi:HAD superfamily hydrolase (TIGR01484 family)
VNRPEVVLSYVTGRHLQLVEEAISEHSLPEPDFLITDVGTVIIERKGGWRNLVEWEREIAADWTHTDRSQLEELFADLAELTPQEPSRQNTFKLSYYTPLEVDTEGLLATMERRLSEQAARVALLWSADEVAGVGLLDLLPENATKLHAIEFVRKRLGFSIKETLFAGDSGNDLQVLTSHVPSVLVANAREDVRRLALEGALRAGFEERLYLARGGLLGMNGNYAAGILEGLVHYYPETVAWLDSQSRTG